MKQIIFFFILLNSFCGACCSVAAHSVATIAIHGVVVQLDENDAIAQESFRQLITQAWTKDPDPEPYRIALVQDEVTLREYLFDAQSLHAYFTAPGAGRRAINPLTRQRIRALGIFDIMPLPVPDSGMYPDGYFQAAEVRFNPQVSQEFAKLLNPHLEVIAVPAPVEFDFDLLLRRLAIDPALAKEYDIKRSVISLDNRRFTKIPSNFFTQLALLVPQLKTLSLVGNRLTALPDSIGELSELEALLLGGNLLQTLPHSIGNLKKLRFLSCYKNNLEEVPDELWALPNLEELFLAHNRLSLVPEAVENLSSLKVFNVSFNTIKIIPDSVGKLINLESLALNSNALTVVPDSLANLYKLRTFSLSNNSISAFPTAILLLRNLRILEIGNNPFLHIPDEIVQLPHLQRLVCDTAKLSSEALTLLKERDIELE